MPMQSRQKAELLPSEPLGPEWNQEKPMPQPHTESMLTESSSETVDLLRSIRSNQIVVRENFDQIAAKLETSEKEKKQLMERMEKVVAGLTKREEELLLTVQKLLVGKEQQMTHALQEVNSLKQELTRGFLEMAIKTKTPLSHQLAKITTVTLGSMIGGILVFLLLTLGVR